MSIHVELEPCAYPHFLDDVIAPISSREFIEKYWLKTHLFCPGPSNKFSSLLSWDTLNEILEHHWRETYRFRLVQCGRDLDINRYSENHETFWTPKINDHKLTQQLRDGATLVFDAIEEVHRPLRRLAESFELFFRASTKINIYAGWRDLHGLDLHRDQQEIFILQLSGRKRWLIYGPNIDHVDKSVLDNNQIPEGAIFDHVINEGDLLYFPRGHYHIAVPMNEPSLHLTVSLKNPRGIHLIEWILNQLREQPRFQKDLPYFGTADEKESFAEDLKQTIVELMGDKVLDRYFYEVDGTYKPRPSFSLPWSAAIQSLPTHDDFDVRLAVHRQLQINTEQTGGIQFSCLGKDWRFPRLMRVVLEILNGDRQMHLNDLVELSNGQLDRDTARFLVAMLVKEGLAVIELPPHET